MFDIGLQEILVIGVIALLVFGPSRLPELGRMAGRAMREFRRASDEFRSTVETNLHINDPDPVIQPPLPVDAGPTSPFPETEPQLLDSVSTPEAPAALADAGEPYCAQRGSRLFHRRECLWVGRIPELERVYLKRMVDAHEEGYRECPACEPWEPA